MPVEQHVPTPLTDDARQKLAADAAVLRDLHVPKRPLVLPNAWDAVTARLVEEAGFPAVATTSHAVAESLGFDDGETAPPAEMLAAARRVSRAVSVPVTVDCESGYGLPAPELVARLLSAGAAGCNLEDTDHRTGGLAEPGSHAERLTEVRAAADEAGVPLVINARVDVFLRAALTGDSRPGPELVGEALERGRAYLAAGADCVFPIMAGDPETIGRLVAGLDGPVNVLHKPDGPALSTLAELGVSRVSLGPGLFRAAGNWLRGELRSLAESVRESVG
ncbi:2-methylisocitrate lyase-like PEP mutase family enzyme [Saccharopolyspora erythraea NRRL 2338]|uniref:Isocitrate lyase/phosphoenolpyruvate mutase family protein n=2 Tax=Saccharopolyspora erythraea TaxID=1836 RepID=A0ABP3N667_SACER|nr:isocitrate lyase/phosphoenolpyruvate mutase family protein [Saccharopolyspora erythraea]EQD82394.1 carboxyvinyl-carboxyphosphonate phosphorylmutase [Saccharopolyspora erythraea D]PFG97079.1 2-methylisocitrate lyase-like PEP mutase family enzyme [Saccharopolyspora erythraea NRRL 2338]QRK87289.1 isocitrate lyase/phosphoenolpyruvate mutase family protein [Saccharopolyspora erythraea]CAM03379.1 probable carboxyvinyl-carboxyphosphonate phosphorylmutase [Saccharopolyspora erythraea NRRL 2338]